MSIIIDEIEINLTEDKTPCEIAEALRIIASGIEEGYTSGIVGWSDISWSIGTHEKEDSNE